MDIIDENDFQKTYLSEQHMTQIAIDYIKIAGYELRSVPDIPTEVNNQEFANIEEMVKQVFPQTIATEDTPVGTATTCVHEIHLKPATRPIKQRIRQVSKRRIQEMYL